MLQIEFNSAVTFVADTAGIMMRDSAAGESALAGLRTACEPRLCLRAATGPILIPGPALQAAAVPLGIRETFLGAANKSVRLVGPYRSNKKILRWLP